MEKKKILFITPSLARTGSEMVLWYLLNAMDQKKITPYLFCLKKGELIDQLPLNIEKSISYRASGKWYLKLFRGLLKMLGVDPIQYQLQRIQSKFKADLWYVNTILIPQAHPAANKLSVTIATHIHELLFAFSFVKAQELKNILSLSNSIIGCSTVVCDLISEVGHPNIKLQPSFIDESVIHPDQQRVEQLRNQLGIKKTDYVWVISGTVAYMKGVDSLLQILGYFKNRGIKIIWLGGLQQNGTDYFVQAITNSKYAGEMIFTDAIGSEYYEYLSLANCLLSISKEESFSLVMLEAAFLGIPIVSFETGMASSFIKPGMGQVVRSWNTSDIIAAMESQQTAFIDIKLLKTAASEYTVANQVPRFERLLLEL